MAFPGSAWERDIYSGFQLDEVHARNPVTLAKPGFSVPHSYEKHRQAEPTFLKSVGTVNCTAVLAVNDCRR